MMLHWIGKLDEWGKERLSWLAERPRWAAAFLVVLCLALYLPGIASLPVTDRDEARFAQATKQMVESGDYVDIRFQQDPRYKKPIGIYWLQAASVSAVSPNDLTQIWAYRIPSLLGIIGAVLLTWWAARPIFGERNALLAAALLATAFTLGLEGRIAKSDAALLAAIVAMQGALARLYLIPGTATGVTVLFWASLGIGILIKGPIAPALALLTILAIVVFDRDRFWLYNLRAIWGVPLMLVIILPWFIAIGITSDWEFYRLAFGEDFLGKIQGAKEKHWGPPGYYFVLFWLSFWPATLITPGGAGLWLWRKRLDRKALFLLAWIVPFWIVLEITPTKLPHYAMPLFPAVAMGAVWVLREMIKGRAAPMRSYAHAAGLWLIIALGLAGFLAFLLIYFKVMPSPWLLPVALLYLTAALATAWAALNSKFHAALMTAAISGVLIYAAAFRFVLPDVNQLWTGREVAEVVAALRPCVSGPAVLTRYREPSAIFLLGTDTQLAEPAGALDALENKSVTFGVFNADQRFELITHVNSDGPARDTKPPRPLACVSGFNINNGKPVALRIYASEPVKAFAACPVPEQYRCAAP